MTISPDESEREHANVADVPVLAFVFDSDAAAITTVRQNGPSSALVAIWSRRNDARAARGVRLQPITSISPPMFNFEHRPDVPDSTRHARFNLAAQPQSASDLFDSGGGLIR
jgi:hypothetical protein